MPVRTKRITRIDTLRYWFHAFNETEFNGKLSEVGLGLTRSKATDGYYEHFPDRNLKGYIRIAERCFDDEDLLKGTLLHEMIHQYQHEVLNRTCNHDAVFCSIARRLERKYGFTVR